METTVGSLRIAVLSDQDFVREALGAAITMRTPHAVVLAMANDLAYEEACTTMEPPTVALVDLSLHPGDGIERIAWITANQGATMPLAFGHKVAQQWVRRALLAGSRGYVALCGALAEVPQALEALGTEGYYCTPMVAAMRERLAQDARGRAQAREELSERELEVLQLACDAEELSYKLIGEKLDLSPRTVESHMESLRQKLGVRTRTGLILKAVRWDLLDE